MRQIYINVINSIRKPLLIKSSYFCTTMKRIIIISALLIISIISPAQKLKLGLQASPQLSWMKSTNTDIQNIESGIGIKYGLEADIFLFGIPRYCLNTGLFVTNHSFKARYNLTSPVVFDDKVLENPVSIKYKINYIEIPLDIKLRTDQFYRLTYYGQFGLTNLINIGATAVSSDSKLDGANVNESIGFYNLGLLLGAGAEYDVGGNTALNFGIQYANYFLDATTIKNLDEKTTINTVRLVIGVMF